MRINILSLLVNFNMNAITEHLSKTRYMQYLSAVTATISVASASTYMVWPSPALPKLQSENSPLGKPVTSEEASWIVSILYLSSIPAVFLGSWSLEKFGRKTSLLATFVFQFFPWLMIIFAQTIEVLYAARFIAGIGLTITTAACTIYNGEIAEKDIRGKLSTISIFLKLLGSLLIFSIGPYISYTWLAIVCASSAVLFLVVFVFMPESPYYLVKAEKVEETRRCLNKLSRNDVDDDFIHKRFMEIQDAVSIDTKNKTTVWEIVSKKKYRRPFLIMIGLKSLQHFSGAAAIDAYMQTIIGLTKSSISPEQSSIIFGSVQVPAVLVTMVLVDKVGRKPLLITSAIGCGISLMSEGIYFYLQNVVESDVSSLAWLPTMGLTLFVMMHPLGIGTLTYVFLGEIFPTNIKEVAVSFFTMYGCLLTFIVTKFFSSVSASCGIHTTFWFFAIVCVFGTIFIILFVPETKGKTFLEIQDLLQRRVNINNNETEL